MRARAFATSAKLSDESSPRYVSHLVIRPLSASSNAFCPTAEASEAGQSKGRHFFCCSFFQNQADVFNCPKETPTSIWPCDSCAQALFQLQHWQLNQADSNVVVVVRICNGNERHYQQQGDACSTTVVIIHYYYYNVCSQEADAQAKTQTRH